VHPASWTYQNIASIKAQLKAMGLSLDWSREFATCDVEYYQHQQHLFLDYLFVGEHGIINRIPVDLGLIAIDQALLQEI
ncbi:hypothetical protein ACC695_40535, partial [Rhizobium ruizarguesonis]